MRNNLLIVSASCLLLAATGCTCPKAHVGEETKTSAVGDGINLTTQNKRSLLASGKIAGQETTLVTVRAIVQSTDKATRTLVLSPPHGKLTSLKVGPEVRNFNQIKIGDEVVVDYYASIVFETREPTASEIALANEGTSGVAARAKLGEKPGGIAAISTVTIVTVDSIDKVNQTITVLDKTGKATVIKATYPENLAFIAKGDKVVATMTEAVAAKVTPVKK